MPAAAPRGSHRCNAEHVMSAGASPNDHSRRYFPVFVEDLHAGGCREIVDEHLPRLRIHGDACTLFQ